MRLESEFAPHAENLFVAKIYIKIIGGQGNACVEGRRYPEDKKAQTSKLVASNPSVDSKVEGVGLGQGANESRRVFQEQDNFLPNIQIDDNWYWQKPLD